MTLFLELFHVQNAENPICEDLNLEKNAGDDALGSPTVYLKPLSLLPALGNCYIFITKGSCKLRVDAGGED